MANPLLYPVNGLRVIVDPFKGDVTYQMATDMGTRRISKHEAERLMAAARDRAPSREPPKVA